MPHKFVLGVQCSDLMDVEDDLTAMVPTYGKYRRTEEVGQVYFFNNDSLIRKGSLNANKNVVSSDLPENVDCENNEKF